MRKYLILFVVVLNILVLSIITNLNSFQSNVAAAPLSEAAFTSAQQVTESPISYKSISAFEFVPFNPKNTLYTINGNPLLLTLGTKSDYDFGGANNIFEAPLNLPDNVMLTGFTVFGVDNDSQGEVKVTLLGCHHFHQVPPLPCETIIVGSDIPNNMGRFQRQMPAGFTPLPIRNQDNFYFLQLEITALGGSGLRSVRLQFVDNQGSGSIPTTLPEFPVVPWNINANEIVPIESPSGNPITVRVCVQFMNAADFDRPDVITDGDFTKAKTLNFGACEDFTGRSIQIRGKGRTTTSGSYQRLQ